jgi:hypothetical protein
MPVGRSADRVGSPKIPYRIPGIDGELAARSRAIPISTLAKHVAEGLAADRTHGQLA